MQFDIKKDDKIKKKTATNVNIVFIHHEVRHGVRGQIGYETSSFLNTYIHSLIHVCIYVV